MSIGEPERLEVPESVLETIDSRFLVMHAGCIDQRICSYTRATEELCKDSCSLEDSCSYHSGEADVLALKILH